MGADNQEILISEISGRLEEVRGRIGEACLRSGRRIDAVALVAVSKTHGPALVDAAIAAGQRDFGENRVQEMVTKAASVRSGAVWHLIGHLQSNKVRKALAVADVVHGVDTVEIAADLNRVAREMGRDGPDFLEVNVSGEASKFGLRPDGLLAAAEAVFQMDRLEPCGLMTMAPLAPEAEASRPFFAALRELREKVERETGVALPHLSMGMSGDYEVAVEEGSTHVRVGTAIFGSRPSMTP